MKDLAWFSGKNLLCTAFLIFLINILASFKRSVRNGNTVVKRRACGSVLAGRAPISAGVTSQRKT